MSKGLKGPLHISSKKSLKKIIEQNTNSPRPRGFSLESSTPPKPPPPTSPGLLQAETMEEIEELWAPYKAKRQTRALGVEERGVGLGMMMGG